MEGIAIAVKDDASYLPGAWPKRGRHCVERHGPPLVLWPTDGRSILCTLAATAHVYLIGGGDEIQGSHSTMARHVYVLPADAADQLAERRRRRHLAERVLQVTERLGSCTDGRCASESANRAGNAVAATTATAARHRSCRSCPVGQA